MLQLFIGSANTSIVFSIYIRVDEAITRIVSALKRGNSHASGYVFSVNPYLTSYSSGVLKAVLRFWYAIVSTIRAMASCRMVSIEIYEGQTPVKYSHVLL